MSEYKNNQTFAIRTILLYRYFQKDPVYRKYAYTLTAGTLLNVLSAALESNEHFCFDFDTLKNLPMPHLKGERITKPLIRGYLTKIMEALSKKTDGRNGNFMCEKEKGNIIKIFLHTKEETPKTSFTDSDLNTLLETLETCIKTQASTAEDYKKEAKKFNDHFSRAEA